MSAESFPGWGSPSPACRIDEPPINVGPLAGAFKATIAEHHHASGGLGGRTLPHKGRTMSFDQIEAELQCPFCGAVNPAGPETGLQVWWTSSPENRALRVGDEVDAKDPELAGYLKLNAPASGEPVRILDTWECTVCGQPYLWAMTALDDDRISSVDAVELGPKVLGRAHYVSNLVRFIYPEITGEPMTDAQGHYRPGWKARLLEGFAAGRRWPPRSGGRQTS